MSDLSVGSTFAGCRLEAVAGRGGMGIVYRATQVALGRKVALKAMTPELAQDAEYRERFQRESHIAASIDHPNVIPVYEAGELEGTLYLLMRWVDGTDLRTLLRDSGPLAPTRALRLLRPVASALASAHRRGLVHRDIKPANVLIAEGEQTDDEHVYLTDFGIARRTEGESAMTRTGVFVGTVDYSAPERIEGSHGDARADIYSFGCMLFEAVSGHVPFERPSEISKIFAHVNDPVPSLRAERSELPEALDQIVQRAMAKRPEDRFGSAGELAGALSDLLQELDTRELEVRRRAQAPTRVRAPEPPPAATDPSPRTAPIAMAEPPTRTIDDRPARRRWTVLALPIVAAAVVAAVLVALLSGGSDKSSLGARSPEITSLSGPEISAVRTVNLGGPPGALAPAAGGAVWASVPERGAVMRVDPGGHKRTATVGGQPRAVAAASTGVWVAGSDARPLVQLDPGTGAARATAHLAATPVALAADGRDGSVWAADSGGTITHVGTDGAALGAPVAIGSAAKDLGRGEGWLWAVTGSSPRGLARVPPGGGTVQRFDGGPAPVAVGFDQGVWMAQANGHVTRFDPRGQYLRVVADVDVGAPALQALAAAEGAPAVWALSRQTRSVYRISRSEQRVTGHVSFSAAPVALALGGRYLWVATAAGKLIQLNG